jgi:hypothetical protein
MELYFETYLIIALIFTVITVCIAGVFLKNKWTIIGLSGLLIILGFLLPSIIINFERYFGSLGDIENLQASMETLNNEIQGRIVRNDPLDPTPVSIYADNIGFINPSIAAGILAGIGIYWLVTRRWRKAASVLPGFQP